MDPKSAWLVNCARERLRGRNALTGEMKSLVHFSRKTTKRLNAIADDVSKVVGFRVWPNQIAALLIEREVGR